MVRIVFSALLAMALTACGDSSPGPLAGTWQSAGIFPMKTTFRNGETESMGIIEFGHGFGLHSHAIMPVRQLVLMEAKYV